VVKRCLFCGRYFEPDKRVGSRQKACQRAQCKRARKQLAQGKWLEKNPEYFKGRYWYVKDWRAKRKNSPGGINPDTRQNNPPADKRRNIAGFTIQIAIQARDPFHKAIVKGSLPVDENMRRDMIQDEIDSLKNLPYALIKDQ